MAPRCSHILIGPLPPPIGGTTVLFQQLVDELKAIPDTDVFVINTAVDSPGLTGRLRSGWVTISAVLGAIRRYDSMAFHASDNGVIYLGPLLVLIARLFRKPLVIRVFGGSLDVSYDKLGWLKKIMFRKLILRTDALLVETRDSAAKFAAIAMREVHWYPNSRPVRALPESVAPRLRRMVFLGHAIREKGILEMVEACRGLDIELDIYGPLVGDIAVRQIDTPNVKYRGVLAPDQVADAIMGYQLLLLPTYYPGEGYPGVIIEAYMAGLPVIATIWRRIPEIVDPGCGILVPPRDVAALRGAIESLLGDPERYRELAAGARRKREFFASQRWTGIYRDMVAGLVAGVDLRKAETAVLPDIGQLRVLMIGSLPPPIGGTTLSFEQLCQYVGARARECIVVDTNTRNRSRVVALAASLAATLRRLPSVDVATMHFSDHATIHAAPLIWLACRLMGRPVVFRQFGGEFARTFANLSPQRQRWLQHTVLRSEQVLMQTRSMVASFGALNPHTLWFPTSRQRPAARYAASYAGDPTKPLRCMFVGHVREAKGVFTAIRAVSKVPEAELDIYGPLIDVAESALGGERVRYCSALDPEAVPEAMAQHDILLFPTMWPGEGYPGVLVEAIHVGLPIIASRWQDLPEMLPDDEAWFVTPGSVEEITGVLRNIVARPALLAEKSAALLARAPEFDAERVFPRFAAICVSAALGR